jgi:cysteine desulfurase
VNEAREAGKADEAHDVHNVYMDYNAATPVRAEAAEVCARVQRECFGNPSSKHLAGRRAKSILDESRERIAASLGAQPGELYFTSGGTEGDNLAIVGVAESHARGHIVTSSIEHPAVLETCRRLAVRGFDITYLPVDAEGRVDPESVRDAIRDDTVLVTIMWVNNETGVIQPIEAIGQYTRARGKAFHSDAVQAFGRVPVDVQTTPVDLITISGHKFCAPKGVGAVYVRRGNKLATPVSGGGQERGLRSGTENLPGIAALAEAGVLACAERGAESQRLDELRNRLEAGILDQVPDVAINGGGASRVANTSNLCFRGADGEELLISLDERRIAVSSASACAAGNDQPSHVLTAMGRSRQEATDSMRFSLGRLSTGPDVDRCLEVVPQAVERVRSLRPR